jgi:membrane-bound ClpP family serine protease
MHAVSTPTAVYVLLVLGFWGIAFELMRSSVVAHVRNELEF